MKTLRAMFVRFAGLFRRKRHEAEMNDELRAHLEGLIDRNVAAGMSPEEARYAALRAFGGVEQIKERARDRLRLMWLENLIRDAGFAVRTLRKCPGFTSIVVLTLALGLGVNTALFTWFNAIAFRPLPVPDPEQLVTLTRLDAQGRENTAVSYADFVAFRDYQTVLSGLAAWARMDVELAEEPEVNAATGAKSVGIRLETVSANYFTVFRVPMALGRPLVAADETSSRAEPIIVLHHRFWQQHFGGDPAVIGRTLRLRVPGGTRERELVEETRTIVGVTHAEFYGTRPETVAGWVPFDASRSDPKATYRATGRLRPGISREQAAEELQVIANEIPARPDAGPRAKETIALARASTYFTLTAKHFEILLPIIGVFGAVFVVSCANASNLILARMVTRQFEFSVRSALGATRPRLFTLLLTESLVLGLCGGIAGWAVAAGLLQFVWPWLIDMVGGAREGMAGLHLHADSRVFGFTVVVSILAGAAGGVLPALHVTRCNFLSALNREGSPFGRGFRLSRVRSFLAVAQLALSSALLFTAGLLVHRALRTQFEGVGFDKSRLLAFEVLAPRTHDAGQLDIARRQVLERIRTLPDVAAVSAMPQYPFASSRVQVSVPAGEETDMRLLTTLHSTVPADYFATLQLPVIRGRAFTAGETSSDRIVVVSETAARTLWPNRDALGQRLDLPTAIITPGPASAAGPTNEANIPRTTFTVVGIVRDTRVYDPWAKGDRGLIYLPLRPQTRAAPYLLIRTHQAASSAIAVLQQVGREVTGIVPHVFTVDDVFAQAFMQHRVIAWVAGILAAISLIVAVIGLYGVMSYTVNQRVKEIGIRIALGVTPRRVASGIVLESLCLVGGGAVVGYGLSMALTVIARNMFVGVSAFEPVACAVVGLFLATIGVFACWMPARRASKVDPIVALRAE
jgi:predicted permease